MSTDYAQMEGELLAWLECDTGRDLPGWMAAIAAAGHTDRNAIIDWLRQQGFIFAHASWLERIHNNGGRPIYLEAVPPSRRPDKGSGEPRQTVELPPPPVPASGAAPPADTLPMASAPPAVSSPPADTAPPAAVAPAVTAPPPTPPPAAVPAPVRGRVPLPEAITAHLSRARAYAPLATHLLRVLLDAVPDARTAIAGEAVVLARGEPGMPFAAILATPREVRLLLALPERAPEPPFDKAKPTGLPADVAARFGHGLSLTDARRVDGVVVARTRLAAGLPEA
jgi:hypothetical protein